MPTPYSLDLGGAAAAGVLQEGWRQKTGAKGGASRLPLTFCLLRFRGCIWGSFPRPLFAIPTLHPTPKPYSLPPPYTYSLHPKPYSLVRCRRRRGRSGSGSPPDSCLFISCKMPAAALRSAAETKNIRARGGWRRMRDWDGRGAPRPLIGEGRCRGRLTGGVEAGDRSKGSGFATSFGFLSAEISGVVYGEVSPDPSLQSTPYTYSLLPKPYSLVRSRRRRWRSVSGSSPVS